MRLWLYQGDALADSATDAYIREMNNSLLPFIARDLEQQLRQYSKSPESLYEALKTYLTLGNSERLYPQHVSLWMVQSWQNEFPRRHEETSRLKMHLDTLLQGAIKPVVLDKQLVKYARKNIQAASLAELVYGRLKFQAMADDFAAFQITDVVGDAANEGWIWMKVYPVYLPMKVFINTIDRRAGASLTRCVRRNGCSPNRSIMSVKRSCNSSTTILTVCI